MGVPHEMWLKSDTFVVPKPSQEYHFCRSSDSAVFSGTRLRPATKSWSHAAIPSQQWSTTMWGPPVRVAVVSYPSHNPSNYTNLCSDNSPDCAGPPTKFRRCRSSGEVLTGSAPHELPCWLLVSIHGDGGSSAKGITDRYLDEWFRFKIHGINPKAVGGTVQRSWATNNPSYS